MTADLKEMSLMVQKGRFREVERLMREALQEGLSPQDILRGGLIAGMSVIGERFKRIQWERNRGLGLFRVNRIPSERKGDLP